MAARKTGLGRGLGALIPSDESPKGYVTLPLEAIDPNPQQPRDVFPSESLQSLAASIREVGVLQPIVVRPGSEDDRYILVAGERRWRAARLAGLREIPAMVRESDDVRGLTEALVENIQREDLTPLQEAAAYRQLLEDFGLTHEEVGARVGKSRPVITNTLRLLALPAGVQALLVEGELSAGHCRALLALEDEKYAESVARKAAAEGWPVRRIEEAVRARLGEKAARPKGRPRRERPAEILALEERLADCLGAPVGIDYTTRGTGRVVIRFGSIEELERIYRVLSES